MAEDNSFGYHHRHQVNFNKGGSGQGRMEPPAQGSAGMREPTNHAGHTYDKGRAAEHVRNVEGMRSRHAGLGQKDHERILHETHKLHQGTFTSHGNKHGESHHIREEAAERRRGEE
jgi:hypothetical protein